jgi:hypothetical protein
MAYPFVLNGSNLSVFLKGCPYTVNLAHPNFKKIVKGLKDEIAEDQIVEMLQIKKELAQIPKIEFNPDGMIYLDGKPMSKALIDRYKFMIENDFPLDGFKNFIRNLAENPSQDSREELYGFLEACSLPITQDGHFLAYKNVDDKYMDCHTHTIDNSVGKIVEMPRENVNANRHQTCSTGLHVCSESYLGSYSGKHTMICKINPRDVVSVPSDYNNAKMRVCQYEVTGEINKNWDSIVDMAVPKEESVKVSEQKPQKAEAKKKGPGKGKSADTGKTEKWDDYIKTRSIPDDLSALHGNPRKAFIKFCARLHNGTEKAGPDICGAKTLTEMKAVIFGF